MKRMVGVLVSVLLLAGCGVSTPTPTAPSSAGEYHQTWATAYGSTSCGEWAGKMSERQRWIAAGDMLVAGRGVWGVTSPPPHALVDTFEADITTACVEPTLMLNLAGALALATGGRAEYGG